MSFATLEEAWGVPTLGGGGGGFATGGFGAAVPPQKAQLSRIRRRRPLRRRVGQGSNARGRPEFSVSASAQPPPELMPSRQDDDVQVMNTRRFLAQTYSRFGALGVARLLPPPALQELCLARRGGGGGGWDDVRKFFSSPEKVLFLLLCAFALLVVWDNWHTASTADAVAGMASMHFPIT